MSLMDTIREINGLRRSIEDQTRLMNDFLRDNKNNMQSVRSELHGSSRGYDQMMLTALQQAETSLTKSIGALNRASEALLRVEQI